jgi:hypothetical protein
MRHLKFQPLTRKREIRALCLCWDLDINLTDAELKQLQANPVSQEKATELNPLIPGGKPAFFKCETSVNYGNSHTEKDGTVLANYKIELMANVAGNLTKKEAQQCSKDLKTLFLIWASNLPPKTFAKELQRHMQEAKKSKALDEPYSDKHTLEMLKACLQASLTNLIFSKRPKNEIT